VRICFPLNLNRGPLARKSSSAHADALNVEAAASYLEEIARGLRSGLVSFGSGGDQVDLHVTDAVTIDVEGKVRPGKKKSSFQVAMRWRVPKRMKASEDASSQMPPLERQPIVIDADADDRPPQPSAYRG
jgi:amphi-Trp domain-containing protein